jgi:hypothetical protein
MFINKLESIMPKNMENPPARSPAMRWIKPPRGFAKINVDAAISKNSSMALMATAARDEDGKFLGALVLVLEGCTNAEMAEVVPWCEGLAIASNLGLQTFLMASD